MLAPPWLLALALVLGLLVLVPARRLQLAGLAPRTIGILAATLWGLGMLVAIRPVASRFLIPILLIAYIAPFVAAPDQLGRVLGRGGGRGGTAARPPMKNVTPSEPGEPSEPDGTPR
jgi:hypothetical protein